MRHRWSGPCERPATDRRDPAERLHAVADEGESAVTPLIEIAIVAGRVIPLVILMIGLIFGVSRIGALPSAILGGAAVVGELGC